MDERGQGEASWVLGMGGGVGTGQNNDVKETKLSLQILLHTRSSEELGVR